MNSASLWAMLSGDRPGFHELRFEDESRWIVTADRRRFIRSLDAPTLTRRWVSVCPRIDLTPDFASEAACLWARVEGTASSTALLAFKPHPTLLLRDGQTTRRTALWALEKPLKPDWAEKAVLRLQHRFAGPKKAVADPTFVFEPPGPRVSVESFDPDALYSAREVVGGLRDGPPAFDWRAAREAA